jgi:hypothetical protein
MFIWCFLLKEHERCFFFQWIDGPEKFDPRYLLFEDWVCRQPRERFHRWVPPPPNPPEMTDSEKEVAKYRRLETPPLCKCGDHAVINPRNPEEFICPNQDEVSAFF